MRLNLTVPGFGGGGKKKKPEKGKIINKDPVDEKTPEEEAEDIFNKTVNPNTANTALYRQHTAGQSRTQARTMTGARDTVKDPTTGEAINRSSSTGVYRDSSSGGVHKRSRLGMVARALKRLTGM